MSESQLGLISEKRFRVLAIMVVGLAGWLAYAGSFTNDFVWDDASSVLLNKHIQEPSFFFQLFREDQHPFGRGQGNFYRPLLASTFMLDYAMSEKIPGKGGTLTVSPFIFHVSSTLWHIGSAVLLFMLFTRLGVPRFVRMAVPLLYVVHPLQTEAVAYISGRGDSMSAAFMFAGLYCALEERGGWRRIVGIVLSAACFGCALLSKESATIFPFLLALLLTFQMNEQRRFSVLRLIPLIISFVLLGIYGSLRMTVLAFASQELPDTSLGQRLVETLQSFVLYIRLLFVPTGLHMERSLQTTPGWLAMIGVVLFGVVVVLILYGVGRKQWRMAAAFGWFLVTWLPISGIFPLNAPMAEHWMYVPMAGFFWGLTEFIWTCGPGRRWIRYGVMGIVGGLCLVFAVMTAARNRDWRDNETIFRATLAQNPKSIRVHYNLAVTYEDLLDNLAGARRHYEAVVNLYKIKKGRNLTGSGPESFWDDELESRLSLGRINLQEKRYDEAAHHFGELLKVSADGKNRDLVATAAMGVGQCAWAMGDSARATEMFKKALTLQPALKSEVIRILNGVPAA